MPRRHSPYASSTVLRWVLRLWRRRLPPRGRVVIAAACAGAVCLPIGVARKVPVRLQTQSGAACVAYAVGDFNAVAMILNLGRLLGLSGCDRSSLDTNGTKCMSSRCNTDSAARTDTSHALPLLYRELTQTIATGHDRESRPPSRGTTEAVGGGSHTRGRGLRCDLDVSVPDAIHMTVTPRWR
jgi:hypothetical protein